MVFVPDLQDTSIPTQIMRFFQQLLKWDREGTYDKSIDRTYTNKLCLNASSKLTISGGVIAPQKAYHTVDTEGAAASDDLDTISADNFSDGDLLILRAEDGGHSVVIKHGTGNIKVSGAVDITLEDVYDSVILLYNSPYWLVLTVLAAVSGSGGDHATMTHLTYSGSGHTGFEAAIAAGSSPQYWRGDKSWQTLNQAAVAGLLTTDAPTFAGLTINGNVILRTTTGTKIGTATNQLLGFWNATPVDQPGAIADATGAGDVVAQLNKVLAALREAGLIAT